MKILYLFLLLPGLVLAGKDVHPKPKTAPNPTVRVVANSENELSVKNEFSVETGEITNKLSVDPGDVSLNNNFENNASSAYAYAAQCGTAGGASGKEFSASVSGESQYCKHLRLSAFYESLYREALSRKDNTMAQLWFNEMVVQIRTADSLVDATSFTGAAKETAADLFMPALVCGGVSVIATPAGGYACAVGIAAKAAHDVDEAKKRETRTRSSLEVRDTQFTAPCKKGTCAYVDGVLHYYEDE